MALLSEEEAKMRNTSYQYNPDMFADGFFRDWYTMLARKNHKDIDADFLNPELRELIKS